MASPRSDLAGAAKAPLRLRPVALPVEHGGWGFTLEPVLLGLMVAPGPAGFALGLFALTAFLTRHPLKIWLIDLRQGRRYSRTDWARRFALLYAAAALAGLSLAAAFAEGAFWNPLAAALPLASFQLWREIRDQDRTLAAELAGAVAMGAMAPAIALAAGFDSRAAYGLWLVLAARSVAAIPYARAAVRRARGKGETPRLAPVWFALSCATALVAAAAWSRLAPWLSVAAVGLLLPVAWYTLRRPPVPAKVIGWTQIVLGLVLVGATAAGVRLCW